MINEKIEQKTTMLISMEATEREEDRIYLGQTAVSFNNRRRTWTALSHWKHFSDIQLFCQFLKDSMRENLH